jgi:cation-transporting ATPase I
MSLAANGEAQILHALPGRIRVHLPAWAGHGSHRVERHLRQLPGVRRVQANRITRNVLIGFDPEKIQEEMLLAALQKATRETAALPEEERPPPPVLDETERGSIHRARIAVRGLDRDPQLARRVVDRLESLFKGVRAWSSPLTGRVMVEYDENRVDLRELVARVAEVELPDLPGEDRPSHPLDPGPLIHGATRSLGAALGLVLLLVRRWYGWKGEPERIRIAATAAGILGLLRSFPALRNGMRRTLGRDAADLLFGSAAIVTLVMADSPLGLTVTGAEGLLLLTEVLARRSAWRRYEERLRGVADADPGEVIRLEAGERTPLAAQVIEGTGTAIGRDGLPRRIVPGSHVSGGARLFGGPFVLELQGGQPFIPEPRPAPLTPTLYSRYLQAEGAISFAYAALTGVLTWSFARTFNALLLVNPRPAIIGAEAANLDAAARGLRAGVTVVGTRPNRMIRLPDILLIDGPRVLSEGLEVATIVPLVENQESAALLALAAGISAAAGSPWGNAFPRTTGLAASNGSFNGLWATATIDGIPYTLGPPEDGPLRSEAFHIQHQGGYLLVLSKGSEGESERGPVQQGARVPWSAHGGQPLGLVALRPRLSAGVAELVRTCQRLGVRLEMLPGGSPEGAQAVARRAGVLLDESADAAAVIRARQQTGAFVAFVSDSAHAAPAFAACDLAIGLSWGRTSRFPARADLLAADLAAVTAIVEAGARRDQAVRDGLLLSVASNIIGAVWGFQGKPGVEEASQGVYAAALAALADGWFRLQGGKQSRSALTYLADPRPERWGRRDLPSVLRALGTAESGLTTDQAAARRRAVPQETRRQEVLSVLLEQLSSPVNGILGCGALLSLIAGGETLDIVIIGATIAINVAAGVWQENQASIAVGALRRLGTATARVVRDGVPVVLPATALVPGDVLLLAPGDRVAADARLLSAQGLEVDEATLTGESVPVPKYADQGLPESRVVLEGSDVVVGTGRAVVVAVGSHTRLGATAAALNLDESEQSPFGARLAQLLRLALPVAGAGGATVVLSGLFWGKPWVSQASVGVSIALAAVPESLPLLAGTGQVGVARRLAGRGALVRRLSAVEALGRVEVACTDKTGTLTEGRLVVRLVADSNEEASLPGVLAGNLRRVLLTAALASPRLGAGDAAVHPTDVAVVQAARDAGFAAELSQERQEEEPFEPAQSFHASVVGGRLCIKGAPEELVPRCSRSHRGGKDWPLDETGRQSLLEQARRLAERGLRVLMVAEGSADVPVEEPQQLTALGFVGIHDPLRPNVAAAVRRCREAGVRVLMITGDHPATARAIALEAGLLEHDSVEGDGPFFGDEILSGVELAELHDDELDRRLERATVIARATPLDKVRIIESLRRQGRTVAMTGDGVNDAPALRLADVSVAMGRGGTEVARQAADVVLADDDFATLVEALVEGRVFWQNIRQALGLLLGGNTGELGLIVGASVLGYTSPLNPRQILVVNLITDALPALSIVLQQPEHRNLASLAREGLARLDVSLRRDVVRRGTATALPSLAAYLIAQRSASQPRAGAVALGTVVATQLAQTLDAGWSNGAPSRSVVKAVAASGGLLASTLLVPTLRDLLGLGQPTPLGWALIGIGATAAVALSHRYGGNDQGAGTNDQG